MDASQSASPVDDVTERQLAVLRCIYLHTQQCGFPPSIREIGAQLAIASTKGTYDFLKALERKGLITRTARNSRSIIVTAAGRKALGLDSTPEGSQTVLVPVVYRVGYGPLDLDEANVEEWLRLDLSLVGGSGRDVFGVRVRGNSMSGDGIVDGSVVLARRTSQAPKGAIVVAHFDDGITCKRYYPERGQVRLESSNPAVAPVYLKQADALGAIIVGVVLSAWRRFDDGRESVRGVPN